MNIKKTLWTIGLVALALAGITNASAQQKYIQFTFTNTAFVTPYTLTNGPSGPASPYVAGTTVTLTNYQNTYAPTGAVPVDITLWQNVPVSFELTSYASTNSVSPTGVQLSLTRDNPYGGGSVDWQSNAFSILGAQLATNVNEVTVPLINGTNMFTGFHWARWDYATNGANTNDVIRKFNATVYR